MWRAHLIRLSVRKPGGSLRGLPALPPDARFRAADVPAAHKARHSSHACRVSAANRSPCPLALRSQPGVRSRRGPEVQPWAAGPRGRFRGTCAGSPAARRRGPSAIPARVPRTAKTPAGRGSVHSVDPVAEAPETPDVSPTGYGPPPPVRVPARATRPTAPRAARCRSIPDARAEVDCPPLRSHRPQVNQTHRLHPRSLYLINRPDAVRFLGQLFRQPIQALGLEPVLGLPLAAILLQNAFEDQLCVRPLLRLDLFALRLQNPEHGICFLVPTPLERSSRIFLNLPRTFLEMGPELAHILWCRLAQLVRHDLRHLPDLRVDQRLVEQVNRRGFRVALIGLQRLAADLRICPACRHRDDLFMQPGRSRSVKRQPAQQHY